MHFPQSTLPIWLSTGLVHATCFNPLEATISSTHQALYTGQTTCREVVSAFLSRIEAYNPQINAIISLDPHSLSIADKYDTLLQTHNSTALGPLFCIPTLLKDNYDTSSLPTTGGFLSLANLRPTRDAPVVQALKQAGAIILGKANLHELALEGISVSSLGGQTLNPYDFTRTPGGSSGGTGATLAASFAVWGTGTDTVNSLRSPASANGLWSLRPTRVLISRRGVIPVSATQDVLGPIARCVEDLAVALGVMVQANAFDTGEGRDNATALIPAGVECVDYVKEVKAAPELKGMRFGVVEGLFNRSRGPETDPVNEAMANITDFLISQGVTIVNITESIYNSTALLELDTQRYEFRQLMDEYLSDPSLAGSFPRSLAELYAPENDDFLVLPAQYAFIASAFRSSTSNATYAPLLQKIEELKCTLATTFKNNNLDAMIYPEQRNLVVPIGSPSQAGRNGILAALTGVPVVQVPVGSSLPTDTARRGIPIGMEVLGREWEEGKLLGIAGRIQEGFEGAVRRVPEWAEGNVGGGSVPPPVVLPERGSVPEVYPLGTLGDDPGEL